MKFPKHCTCQLSLEVQTFHDRNGRETYALCCLVCGNRRGPSIKASEATKNGKPPAWTTWIKEEYDAQYKQKLLDWQLYNRNCDEQKSVEKKQRYKEYLQTSAWTRKRSQVMQRENYLCEGCRDFRATVVHHMTYDHIGQELLYELRALCANCHEKAHGPKTTL
jgi:hypothetical protein